MVKVVALNTVHICKEAGKRNDQGRVVKAAKINVIKPGQIFEATQKEFNELKASNSVREATKLDIAAARAEDTIVSEEEIPQETLLETSET